MFLSVQASDHARRLEQELYRSITADVVNHAAALRHLASLVAEADVYSGFAQLALEEDYCRPVIIDGGVGSRELQTDESEAGDRNLKARYSNELTIVDGRHPVVEQVGPMLRHHQLSASLSLPLDAISSCLTFFSLLGFRLLFFVVGCQITESPLVGGADFVRNSVSLGSIGAPSIQELQKQLQSSNSVGKQSGGGAGEEDEFEQLYSSFSQELNIWEELHAPGSASPDVGIGSRPRETSRPDLLTVTGPNASGKSCFLRQIALIQILAQVRLES